jgi:hypothetical protein
MDYKMAFLLNEGFSINTITNMDSRQLGLIYEKIKKVSKEPKEAVTKTTTSTTYSKDEAKGKTFNKDEDVNVTINKDDSVTVTKEGEVTEKSVSKKQQQFFGVVRGMQKGDIPKKGNAGKVSKEISVKDAKDFASTKHKGLPKKIETTESIKKGVKRNDQKDMIDGVIEIIKKVKDINNRKSIAKDMVNKFKRENIQTDFNKFMEDCGVDDTKKPVKNIGTNKSDEQKKSKNFIQKTTKKNTNGYKGVDHEEKNEVKKLEETILKLVENYLYSSITKKDLLTTIKKYK